MRDRFYGQFADWDFFERDFGKPGSPKILYSFALKGEKPFEYFNTLDEAIVAAIAEKHVGRRGAGGTAVGTISDWFWHAIRGYNNE